MITAVNQDPLIFDVEQLKKVLSYKNPHIVARIAKENDIEMSVASQIFEDTLRFLFICGTQDGTWSPSVEIDKGWHEFIMFTKEYSQFCTEHFGRYLHHAPNVPGGKTDPFAPVRTLKAACDIFGAGNLSANWQYAYRNKEGFLTAADVHLDPTILEAYDPCSSSCGCSAACTDD